MKSLSWFFSIGLCLFFSLTACNEKDACERILAKNKSCKEAYIAYIQKDSKTKMKRTLGKITDKNAKKAMQKRIPKELEKMGNLIKETMTTNYFLKECRKHWNSTHIKDQKKKARLAKCLTQKDCHDYVNCVMSVMRTR